MASSTGIDEGDVRAVEQAVVTIRDKTIYDYILSQLDRCDRAYSMTEMVNEPAYKKLLYTGDLNRARIDFEIAESSRLWNENYLLECDKLGKILNCPNYWRPEVEQQRRQRLAAVYVYPIDGPADTCIISQLDAIELISGGTGF
jgi:hypothetical protein